MKGTLQLSDRNEYYIYDNRGGKSYNLSHMINDFRNDEVEINFIANGLGHVLRGQISSRRRFKNIYDIFIGDEVDSLKNETRNDFKNETNLTQLLFDNIGEKVSFDIKAITIKVEREDK